jgi:hypothetical protein
MTEQTKRSPTVWIVAGGMVVLVVLAVVGLFMVRGYLEDERVSREFDACMEYRGLGTFNPEVDGVDYAEHAAQCAELAQRD